MPRSRRPPPPIPTHPPRRGVLADGPRRLPAPDPQAAHRHAHRRGRAHLVPRPGPRVPDPHECGIARLRRGPQAGRQIAQSPAINSAGTTARRVGVACSRSAAISCSCSALRVMGYLAGRPAAARGRAVTAAAPRRGLAILAETGGVRSMLLRSGPAGPGGSPAPPAVLVRAHPRFSTAQERRKNERHDFC